MRKYFSFILTTLLLIGCTTVPITGRKQLSIIPNNQILPLSYTSYSDVLSQSKLSTNTEQVQLIKNVGAKIQVSVEQFMAKHNMSDHLEGYEWEFNLFDFKPSWTNCGIKLIDTFLINNLILFIRLL